jgi:hypothetical protein
MVGPPTYPAPMHNIFFSKLIRYPLEALLIDKSVAKNQNLISNLTYNKGIFQAGLSFPVLNNGIIRPIQGKIKKSSERPRPRSAFNR